MSNAKRLGFYLHTSWEFAYPYAVRSWEREDFRKFFALLQQLGFNMVMFWPLTEAMPAPLAPDDEEYLRGVRSMIEDAHACGLEFWATFTANVTSRPEIAEKPFKERHLYPYRIDVRLDDEAARTAYLQHRAEVFGVLNNADAYVTIDGDPGGYPGAAPEELLRVLHHDRTTISHAGTHPESQKVVPWLWSGWGANWEGNGYWNEPLEPLTAPILNLVREELAEPWELLPGRSIREDWANGRVNFQLVEDAGLTERSVLLCYEIIEYEPTPPAIVLQFEDIRRVLRQESPLIEKARGLMGNAQQPVCALQNLFFFARAAAEPAYLDRSDEDVLRDFATFLGGDPAVLLPAWQCFSLPLNGIPADLPQRLRASRLESDAAQLLPGGPDYYLEMLALWAETRLEVLRACEAASAPEQAAYRTVAALVAWWGTHRYVFSGEQGLEFRAAFSHPALCAPLAELFAGFEGDKVAVINAAARRLGVDGVLREEQAREALGAWVG